MAALVTAGTAAVRALVAGPQPAMPSTDFSLAGDEWSVGWAEMWPKAGFSWAYSR